MNNITNTATILPNGFKSSIGQNIQDLGLFLRSLNTTYIHTEKAAIARDTIAAFLSLKHNKPLAEQKRLKKVKIDPLKRDAISIMVNGEFVGGKENRHFTKWSSWFALDIDNIDDPDELESTIEKLKGMPGVFAIQKTMSGNGVWALVKIMFTDPNNLNLSNDEISKQRAIFVKSLAAAAGIDNVDDCVSDLSRKRIISYFPIHIIDNVNTQTFTLQPIPTAIHKDTYSSSDILVPASECFIDEIIKNILEKNPPLPTKRNRAAGKLCGVLNSGGIPYETAISRISRFNADPEFHKHCRRYYKTYVNNFNTKPLCEPLTSAQHTAKIKSETQTHNLLNVAERYIPVDVMEDLIFNKTLPGEIHLIVSGGGNGKTTAVSNACINRRKNEISKRHKESGLSKNDFLISDTSTYTTVKAITPFTSIRESLRDKKICEDGILPPLTIRPHEKNKTKDTVYNFHKHSVIVSTFSMHQKRQNDIPYDILIVDEAHLLANTFDDPRQIFIDIIKQDPTKRIILMTATPDAACMLAADKTTTIKTSAPARIFNLTMVAAKKPKKEMLQDVYNLIVYQFTAKSGKKILCQINNINEIIRLENLLNKEFTRLGISVNVETVHSEKTREDRSFVETVKTMDEIDVLLTTSVLNCGVDFNNKITTSIIMDPYPLYQRPEDISQFINRERINPIIDFYLFHYTRDVAVKNPTLRDHKLFTYDRSAEEKIRLEFYGIKGELCFEPDETSGATLAKRPDEFDDKIRFKLASENLQKSLSSMYMKTPENLWDAIISHLLVANIDVRCCVAKNVSIKEIADFEWVKAPRFGETHMKRKLKSCTSNAYMLELLNGQDQAQYPLVRKMIALISDPANANIDFSGCCSLKEIRNKISEYERTIYTAGSDEITNNRLANETQILEYCTEWRTHKQIIEYMKSLRPDDTKAAWYTNRFCFSKFAAAALQKERKNKIMYFIRKV